MSEEIIEQYLRGEISKEVLTETIKDSKEIERITGIKEGLRLSAMQSQLKLLQSYEEEIVNEDDSQVKDINVINISDWFKSKRNTIMSIAAAIALMAITVTMFNNNNNTVNSSQLYAEHYDFYAAVEGVRSDGNATDISESLNAYNQKKYDSAIVLFDDLTTPFARRHFYKGICQMELNNFSEAILSFEKYEQSDKTEEALPYRYYIGLCYLKQENIEMAKRYFSEIPEGEYGFKNARDILSTL